MVLTTQVFTPTKTPEINVVRRQELWDTVSDLADQGGAFIPVLGVTKLGKTTLIKKIMIRGQYIYIPAQELAKGTDALWSHLAASLEIPTSTTTGLAVGDKRKWGFFGKFGVKIPGIGGVDVGSSVDGEQSTDRSVGSAFQVQLSSAVTEALKLLTQSADEVGTHPPMIVLDDFHFITSVETRREILQALRPIMENGATLILASLPGREKDEAYKGTQLDGRLAAIQVERWSADELKLIAAQGFKDLNIALQSGVVDRLVAESYGSPQIMQQLCLNVCRINGVRDDNSGVSVLGPPEDWPTFFRMIDDSQSKSWLEMLGLGLTERGKPRNRATLRDGRKLDGYQLILLAISELGAPYEVPFTTVAAKVADLLEVAVSDLGPYALEQKAKNMNTIASREMNEALEKHATGVVTTSDDVDAEQLEFSAEEIRVAELIPQPVFEASGDKAQQMILRIMNPLLAYALKWHPESFESPKAT